MILVFLFFFRRSPQGATPRGVHPQVPGPPISRSGHPPGKPLNGKRTKREERDAKAKGKASRGREIAGMGKAGWWENRAKASGLGVGGKAGENGEGEQLGDGGGRNEEENAKEELGTGTLALQCVKACHHLVCSWFHGPFGMWSTLHAWIFPPSFVGGERSWCHCAEQGHQHERLF